jgi:hypothetical protein
MTEIIDKLEHMDRPHSFCQDCKNLSAPYIIVYKLTIQSDLSYSFTVVNTFDSFLAGLCRNQWYSAYFSAQTADKDLSEMNVTLTPLLIIV